jgi:hypothetical protein
MRLNATNASTLSLGLFERNGIKEQNPGEKTVYETLLCGATGMFAL